MTSTTLDRPAQQGTHRAANQPVHSSAAGPRVIIGLIAALGLLWAVAMPAGESLGTYAGQAIGALSMLLMSLGLVLVSFAPQVERWFGGFDTVIIWHRWLSGVGFLLLFPHAELSANPAALDGAARVGHALGSLSRVTLLLLLAWAMAPRLWRLVPRIVRVVIGAPFRALGWLLMRVPGVRGVLGVLGGYNLWRVAHHLTVLSITAGFVHGVLSATMFDQAPVLRWTYLAVGAVGLGAYALRLLMGWRLHRSHRYLVTAVDRLTDDMTELTLEPVGQPMRFSAGQFANVVFPGGAGTRRHPFTIASSPDEPVLRFSIKALGDFTRELPSKVRPGMVVKVRGPYGGLIGEPAGQQVWIAGGVGITPMLSKLRDRRTGPTTGSVDVFYSTRSASDDAFVTELAELAAGDPAVRLHVIDTSTRSRLLPEEVLEAIADTGAVTVTLVGPTGMVAAMQAGLAQAGVARARILTEHFAWR